jgi:hypothetical protein
VIDGDLKLEEGLKIIREIPFSLSNLSVTADLINKGKEEKRNEDDGQEIQPLRAASSLGFM